MKSSRRQSRLRGYTMVEVLAALFISGILMDIALPSYLAEVYRARQGAANANAKSLAIAMQSHAVTSQVYDTTLNDYAADLGGTLPLNPCTATTTGYTITSTSTTATITANAGTACGTWSPITYSLTL